MGNNQLNILLTMPSGRDRDSFFTPTNLESLRRIGCLRTNHKERQFTQAELAQGLKNVDILITGWGTAQISEEVLQQADRLMIIAHTGASVSELLCPLVYNRGIHVLAGNEIIAADVAEATLAYALCLLRDVRKYNRQIEQEGWASADWYNESLFEKTVGLVGFGAVARHFVNLLKPFNANILVYADFLTDNEARRWGVKKTSLEELFTRAEVVSLHLSYLPETHHIITRKLLGMLQPGAVFINTARGGLVDEGALAEMLMEGRFRAALDVFETEPLPMDSPLRGLENALLIPHMAGPTFQSRRRVAKVLIEEIQQVLQGNPSYLAISKDAAFRMTRNIKSSCVPK